MRKRYYSAPQTFIVVIETEKIIAVSDGNNQKLDNTNGWNGEFGAKKWSDWNDDEDEEYDLP